MDRFTEDAVAAHTLVARILVGFGLFVLAAAVVAGPLLRLDLGFLTPLDMAVIGTVMLGLGAWMEADTPD